MAALADHAIAANTFDMGQHEWDSGDVNRDGGVKGLHPVDADYLTWRYPNWAAKFFMDALMLQVLGSRAANTIQDLSWGTYYFTLDVVRKRRNCRHCDECRVRHGSVVVPAPLHLL